MSERIFFMPVPADGYTPTVAEIERDGFDISYTLRPFGGFAPGSAGPSDDDDDQFDTFPSFGFTVGSTDDCRYGRDTRVSWDAHRPQVTDEPAPYSWLGGSVLDHIDQALEQHDAEVRA